MRFLIVLAHDLAIHLEKLAKRDHRSIRGEAEWLLSQAIKEAAQESPCAQGALALEAAYAPAPTS